MGRKKLILISAAVSVFIIMAYVILGVFALPESDFPMGPAPENPIGVTIDVIGADNASLTVRLTQSGGEPTGRLQYGTYYWIETLYRNGKWYRLRPQSNAAFTLEAYQLNLGSQRDYDVTFSGRYGKLAPGTYRFCMEIMDFREAGDYTDYPCFAEFSVE